MLGAVTSEYIEIKCTALTIFCLLTIFLPPLRTYLVNVITSIFAAEAELINGGELPVFPLAPQGPDDRTQNA
jgi:hypothetical protein